ncbi:ABC transporter ATP-binding protein [Plantactinospora endophytica]|uniref:ABC transporter ATP-binding protein n=1 Tax=Plantactinospora endophytica TaxID=673535 RepID=A0ABQ4E7T3_9ACTN|nr:ABC transporter ATP-binding protein [Plantactinospora endophytica]GIG90347.1 ABC transporter ATP-binding protein [Plantactinospora endophytica]
MLTRLLRRSLRPYRKLLGLVILLQVAATTAALNLPRFNAEMIDQGIARGDTGTIIRSGSLMLVVTLAQILCSSAAVRFSADAAMSMGRDLRAEVFRRVGSFTGTEMRRFGVPSLVNRTVGDVYQVQFLVVIGCTVLVAAPIMCVGGVLMAYREDPGLSWLLLVAVPVIALAVGLVIRLMVPHFRLMRLRVDALASVLRDQLGGVRVVRAFAQEPRERERFGRVNADLTATTLRAAKLQIMLLPVVVLAFNVSSIAVLWFGAAQVESGALQVGALIAFLQYLVQILMSVMMATFMVISVPGAAVSAERITEVLDTRPSMTTDPAAGTTAPGAAVADGTPASNGAAPHGSARPAAPRSATGAAGPNSAGGSGVELRGVSFQYPGAEAPALRDVTFRAEPGQVTAVVGSTGAGKSTLLALILRLLDASDGAVLVDGVDVRRWNPDELRDRIGVVPQRPYLFAGTVASNLRFGNPDASDEELWHCLEVAQAREFVAAMPGGLDATIRPGGTNVSGGQRQRLTIARALVRRPAVYLFDDSFSALDLPTDARLRDALRPFTSGAAVIVVAQRITTIADADRIVVLDDGAVADVGRHEELLGRCPTYGEIMASQQAEVPAA